MRPQPNKQEIKEFYTLGDLLRLKLGQRTYILVYERVNGEAGVIFRNTDKQEIIALLREIADHMSRGTEADFRKIRGSELQN